MTEPRAANQVFISLGSNIDPERNLPEAVQLLGQFGEVTGVSTVYETLPVGYTDQSNFLNAAVLLETERSLSEMLETAVPDIERSLHRVRDPARLDGPRTIDLDVLLFNDLVIRTGRHELPDPDILRYAFVAVPLAELDPERLHPVTGEQLRDIAARFLIDSGDMQPRRDVSLL
jgi:2-amino-4-hydroxy-6-hydroxymethyldihydropteridine diphosphokinase